MVRCHTLLRLCDVYGYNVIDHHQLYKNVGVLMGFLEVCLLDLEIFRELCETLLV